MAIDGIPGGPYSSEPSASVMTAKDRDGKIQGIVLFTVSEHDQTPKKTLDIDFLASTGKVHHTGTELFSKAVQQNPGIPVRILADGGAKTFYAGLGMELIQGKTEGTGPAWYEWSAKEAAHFAAKKRDVVNKDLAFACGAGDEGSPGFQPGNTCAREEGGGGVEGGKDLARVERAKQSKNLMTKEKKRIATKNEIALAKAIKGMQTPDNKPFDVLTGSHAIEVKTIMPGAKNDKITMHPESLDRKEKFAKKNRVVPHTVAIDQRDGTVYYKKGLGSFRLANMEKLNSLEDVMEKLV